MTPYGSVGASKQIDSRKDRQNKSRGQFMALVTNPQGLNSPLQEILVFAKSWYNLVGGRVVRSLRIFSDAL